MEENNTSEVIRINHTSNHASASNIVEIDTLKICLRALAISNKVLPRLIRHEVPPFTSHQSYSSLAAACTIRNICLELFVLTH